MSRDIRRVSDGRGVSDVVGFVFIFAIIVLSIAVVSASGYAGIEHTRNAEQVNSVTQAFDVFADNVEDVQRHGAPSRTTDVRLAGGTVSLGNATVLSVTGHRVGDPANTTINEQYDIRPLVYDAPSGSQVVYVNGAVVRVDGDGVVMLREPGLLVDESETVLSVVQLRPARNEGLGGGGTVHLRVTADDPVLAVATTTPHVVTVTVVSEHADAWELYLNAVVADDPSGTCARVDATTVSCTRTTDRTFLTVVGAELRIE